MRFFIGALALLVIVVVVGSPAALLSGGSAWKARASPSARSTSWAL